MRAISNQPRPDRRDRGSCNKEREIEKKKPEHERKYVCVRAHARKIERERKKDKRGTFTGFVHKGIHI